MASCLKTINQSRAWNPTKAPLHLYHPPHLCSRLPLGKPQLSEMILTVNFCRNTGEHTSPVASISFLVSTGLLLQRSVNPGSGSISAEGGGGGWCSRKRKYSNICFWTLYLKQSQIATGSHWGILLSNARNLIALSFKKVFSSIDAEDELHIYPYLLDVLLHLKPQMFRTSFWDAFFSAKNWIFFVQGIAENACNFFGSWMAKNRKDNDRLGRAHPLFFFENMK